MDNPDKRGDFTIDDLNRSAQELGGAQRTRNRKLLWAVGALTGILAATGGYYARKQYLAHKDDVKEFFTRNSYPSYDGPSSYVDGTELKISPIRAQPAPSHADPAADRRHAEAEAKRWLLRNELESIRLNEEKTLEQKVGQTLRQRVKLHYEFTDPTDYELKDSVGKHVAGWREITLQQKDLTLTYSRMLLYRVKKDETGKLAAAYDPSAAQNQRGMLRANIARDGGSITFNRDWKLTAATYQGTPFRFDTPDGKPAVEVLSFEESLRAHAPQTRVPAGDEIIRANKVLAWAKDELAVQSRTQEILDFMNAAHAALEPPAPKQEASEDKQTPPEEKQ